MKIQLAEIVQAAERLRKVIHKLPLSLSATFSKMSGAELYFKFENQQKTGSFKIRGAYNKIARHVLEHPTGGVVAASAGNHAQGVAFAASALGVPSTIVMPKSTPIAKISATQDYGAQVVLYGDCYDEAYQKALEIQSESGDTFIHPFNDCDVIAGQATIGLEIMQELPDVDTIILPAGGGGLLAGVASYCKAVNPAIRIIGVQAEGADAIVRSFHQGSTVNLTRVQTIADGIAVKVPGDRTMEIINEMVDEMVSVSDEEIAAAILLLLERNKQVVEPAGAASLAAALSPKIDLKGQKTVCVLTGGNIDVSFMHRIIEKGLIKRGRQMRFRTVMLDIPGSLEHFSRIVASFGANIIMVQHDRLQADLNLNEAILHIACEVGSAEHGERLIEGLTKEGYKVVMES